MGDYNGKKAIKKAYGGVLFKSTLEAHWAQYFEENVGPWKYEPGKVQIDAFRYYTPDFSLHLFDPPVLVEVKPTWEMVTEDPRLLRLSSIVSNICLGICGDPYFSPMTPDKCYRAYLLEDGEVCAVWGPLDYFSTMELGEWLETVHQSKERLGKYR